MAIDDTYGYREKSKFFAHVLREGTYRILLQLPLILVGAFHVYLAVFVCGYSVIMGNHHFLSAFARQKEADARATRRLYLGAGTTGVWGKHPQSPHLKAFRWFQRGLWFTTCVLIPVGAVAYLVEAGMFTELAFTAAGFSAALLATRGRLALPLATLVETRRAGWWSKMSRGARVGACLAVVVTPLVAGAAFYYWATPEKRTHMVEMSDGTRLATDVYLPRWRGSTFPVVLSRTPYGKDGIAGLATLYCSQGFAVVAQDMRGRFASEGEDQVFRFDYTDGVDTVEWILDQPWCDGKIASWGGSALGINQYYYAGMGPRGLVAQMIIVGTPELYDHLLYTGGAYRKCMIDGWLSGIGSYDKRSIIIDHPTRSSFYNSTSLSMAPGPLYGNVRAKAVHLGGWYDIMSQGTIDGFVGYNYHGTGWARGNQTLVIGPWPHGLYLNEVGELKYPENAKNSTAETIWQDLLAAELTGDEAAAARYAAYPRVNYYMMGPDDGSPGNYNEWRYANDWPLPGAANQSWYLAPAGALTRSAPTSASSTNFLFDPADPVPTLGGANLLIPAGPYDQSSLEARGDVLVFSSGALAEPVVVTGHVWARLSVSTNCSDTDFSVKLLDAYPDGRSMLVTEGYLRARYWQGLDHESLLAPGSTYDLTIDLWSTAYYFAPGHRIRLSVTSSNYPRFDLNPNLPGPVSPDFNASVDQYAVANNTLWFGPGSTSALILPVVPNAA
ncbi:MAG: CocE/NonD family hydrolase [Promethearchaeota archaeon]